MDGGGSIGGGIGCSVLHLHVILGNLSLLEISWSISRLVHGYFALRVGIDTQTNLILVKIVYGVEVPQESISNKEQVLIFTWKSTLMNNEETFVLIGSI